MAPIGLPLITATCTSWPPMYSSKIKSLYFLNNLFIDLINFFLLLQISTPRLEPSLIGFKTIGYFIFFIDVLKNQILFIIIFFN